MIRLFYYLLFLSFSVVIFSSCSTSSRYVEKTNENNSADIESINVLLGDKDHTLSFIVESPISLSTNNTPVAIVNDGNRLNFYIEGNSLNLRIREKVFSARYFELKPIEGRNFFFYKGKKYRGLLKIISDGNLIRIINRLTLENYLKGVVPAEMPIGKGDDYFQALKAFAICTRTYAINKMHGNDSYFDVYLDTRDQVYGGVGIEKALSNRAVDETTGMILTYDNKPAKVYYHASCGGHTEDARNVFGIKDEPYLQGVEDGDPPNCSIARGFVWEENYPGKIFVERLISSGLIDRGNYQLKDVDVKGRDESGRVSQLEITLTTSDNDDKIVRINGNRIRSVIRTADNSNILKSTLFNISFENNIVKIKGKGKGHGVGLCQWGAIHQSIEGKNFKSILSFYFPSTEVEKLK